MSNEDEKNIEGQEQQPESPVENFEEVVETQETEVAKNVSEIEEAGEEDVSRIEDSGLSEEVEEMGDVAKEISEKAEEAKEEYEEQLKSIPNVNDKVEAIKKEDKTEDIFFNNLENQSYFSGEVQDEYVHIKDSYRKKLIGDNKMPEKNETWDDLILKEIDKNYAEYIKENINNDYDKKLTDYFLESNDKRLLTLKNRQEFLNIFFKNHYKIYANESGDMVSMSDYLKDYYKDIGVDIEIKFKTVDSDIRKDLSNKVLQFELLHQGVGKEEAFKEASCAIKSNDERVSYIFNDEVAVPHVIVKTKNGEKEVPIIAGSSSFHMPLRSEEKDEDGYRKRKGHFVQLPVIHEPQCCSTVQKIIIDSIHEIDHAVTENLFTKEQKLLDQELLSEGIAEKASIVFMNTQHKYLKDNSTINNNFDGYDYQANLQQIYGRHAVNEKTSKNQEHRYAQGYIIADGYDRSEGREKYKKLFYIGELNFNEELGNVVEIRKKIDEKLENEKAVNGKIISGGLNE
ncbi:MAG: hypothetical protein KAU07_03205 [Candidatus Andersenbacteria bacterium]|nr:hypothetical protein [Candidatus Andersenbacteria bacterium]